MLKLFAGIIKCIALALGLVVLGMVAYEKYGDWRLQHEVPECVQEVEVAVSNYVSSVKKQIAEVEGTVPRPARKLVEESLGKCSEVVDITTGGLERVVGKSKPISSRDRYACNLQRLEDIRESLVGQ